MDEVVKLESWALGLIMSPLSRPPETPVCTVLPLGTAPGEAQHPSPWAWPCPVGREGGQRARGLAGLCKALRPEGHPVALGHGGTAT